MSSRVGVLCILNHIAVIGFGAKLQVLVSIVRVFLNLFNLKINHYAQHSYLFFISLFITSGIIRDEWEV